MRAKLDIATAIIRSNSKAELIEILQAELQELKPVEIVEKVEEVTEENMTLDEILRYRKEKRLKELKEKRFR
jgi:flagellar biosynthesis/type III secretory pathway chaperone